MEKKCDKCNKELTYAILTIIDGYCWKCHSMMKVAVVQGGVDRTRSTAGPDEFSKLELDIAQSNGVVIKEQYSKTMDESYLVNCCAKCNSFIGNFFLHKDYMFPASQGELESVDFKGEPYCESCTEAELRSNFN